ncbi:MAG: type II secretion system F family protein [bacterium]
MKFKYKAIKNNGERVEGIKEAQNRLDLYNDIKSEEAMLISAEEVKKNSFDLMSIVNSIIGRVSVAQKIAFAKNLGLMLDAGLSLTRALSVLERQIKNARFSKVMAALNLEIKKGKTFSEAMKTQPSVFSGLFVSMVRAGEEGGSLSKSLNNIAEQMDKTYKIQKKVKGAMIYPAVIISVMLVVGVLMFIYVVPGLVGTFRDAGTDLPASTQFIIMLSDFLSAHWLYAIIILLTTISVIYVWAKTPQGSRTMNLIAIKAPLIGELVRETNTARVARTLSSLLEAGVPFAQAIEITAEVMGNYYYKKVLIEAKSVVEKGENISTIFMKSPDLYPPFVGEMMSVGEETGKMASMLSEVAIFYEADVDQRTKDMSTIIEPVLMVLIGAAVGFFAISMISPIYSVMDKI